MANTAPSNAFHGIASIMWERVEGIKLSTIFTFLSFLLAFIELGPFAVFALILNSYWIVFNHLIFLFSICEKLH